MSSSCNNASLVRGTTYISNVLPLPPPYLSLSFPHQAGSRAQPRNKVERYARNLHHKFFLFFT